MERTLTKNREAAYEKFSSEVATWDHTACNKSLIDSSYVGTQEDLDRTSIEEKRELILELEWNYISSAGLQDLKDIYSVEA